jgi:hypothetical protein
MNRLRCSSNGVASDPIVFCAAVWCPRQFRSPVNSRTAIASLRYNLAGARPSPSDRQCPQVDLAHHRDVAVRRRAKLPIHRKFSIRSCQPSLAPTNPQLMRENPQLAAIASDHSFFHASSTLCPARSTARAELPAPPPSRCGASSAYTFSRGSRSACPPGAHAQHHRVVRIADDLLGQRVAPSGSRFTYRTPSASGSMYSKSTSGRASPRGQTSPRRSPGTPCPAPARGRSWGGRPRSEFRASR